MTNRETPRWRTGGARRLAIAAIALTSLGVLGDLELAPRAEAASCTLYCGTSELECEPETHKAIDFEPRNAGGPAHVDCLYGGCSAANDHGCGADPIDAVSAAVAARDTRFLARMVASDTLTVNEYRSALQLIGRCSGVVVAHFQVDGDFIAALTVGAR